MYPLILVPTYGRTCASKEEALELWRSGADFRIDGQTTVCSIRDIDAMKRDWKIVSIRYGKGLYLPV